MSAYSIDRKLRLPFAVAVARVKSALKEQGFGTLTELDIRAILQEKIGKEIAGYTILGVCNPQLAAQAIEAEPNVGIFLPCTVLLRQDGDSVTVSAQDPALMESLLNNPTLEPLSTETRRRMIAALDTLGDATG